MSERVEQLITYLEGSCKTLSEACLLHGFDEEQLEQSEIEHLHDSIFVCDGCGWWYSYDEMSDAAGEQICLECNEEKT